MITVGVGITGLIVGFFAGEKIALMVVKTNLRDQGWSDEAIKKKVFKIWAHRTGA